MKKIEGKLFSNSCEEVLRTMPDNSINCVIAHTLNLRKYTRNARSLFYKKLSEGGILVVAMPNVPKKLGKSIMPYQMVLLMSKMGFKLIDSIIFNNDTEPSPYQQSACIINYSCCDRYKTLFIFSKGKPSTFNLHRISNVWTYDEEDSDLFLPDQISEDLILTWTKKDDLIFIPFEDNGFIAKAAIANERRWFMSEVPRAIVKHVSKNIFYGATSFDLSRGNSGTIRVEKRKLITKPSFTIVKDPTRKVFITSEEFYALSSEERNEAIKRIFLHYRKNGFPYPEMTEAQISAELYKLKTLDTNTLLVPKNNILKRNKIGLSVANIYMPHMYGVKCHNYYTPLESFNNTKLFLRTIKKAIEFNGGVRDSTIRSALKWVTGTQMVSNFRPTIAKYIYDNYAGKGKVLDFSCGYGGRLLGALSSLRVNTYVGTDPCKPTYKQLLAIKRDFGEGKRIKIYNEPFEDVKLPAIKFDLAFSSPPYFHQEEYGDEEGQSFKRYTTKEKWRDGFLKPLIKKCYQYLKTDGYFALNIANIETYKTFEEDALKIAERAGFTLTKTYLMSLSKLFTGLAFKFEPVYIFRKKKFLEKK